MRVSLLALSQHLLLVQLCGAYSISSSSYASKPISFQRVFCSSCTGRRAGKSELAASSSSSVGSSPWVASSVSRAATLARIVELGQGSNNSNDNLAFQTTQETWGRRDSFFPLPMENKNNGMDLPWAEEEEEDAALSEEELGNEVTALQGTVSELTDIISDLRVDIRTVVDKREQVALQQQQQQQQTQQESSSEGNANLKNTFSRIMANQVEMSKQLGLSIVEMKVMQEQQSEFLKVKLVRDQEMSQMISFVQADMQDMKYDMKLSHEDHCTLDDRLTALEQKLAERQQQLFLSHQGGSRPFE
jgi:hypothetical protein